MPIEPTLELTPRRIRAIREDLGLTQEEAGRLLGGGLRAFTKYEAGILKPSAAATNLLRVLEVIPDARRLLLGGEIHPASSWESSPIRSGSRRHCFAWASCVYQSFATSPPCRGPSERPSPQRHSRCKQHQRFRWRGGRANLVAGQTCAHSIPAIPAMPVSVEGRQDDARWGGQGSPDERRRSEADGPVGTRAGWTLHHALCTPIYPAAG